MRRYDRPHEQAILECFYTFPYLTAEQVTRLLYSPGSIQGVRAHLKNLVDKEALARDKMYGPGINTPYIYWLATKGRNQLKRKGYDFSGWKYAHDMPTFLRSLHVDHYMATTDFLIAATQMPSLVHSLVLKLVLHDFTLKRWNARVIPDGLLHFHSDTGKDWYYAVEIDLGSEKEHAFLEKIGSLVYFVEQGAFEAVYGIPQPPVWLFYEPTPKLRDERLSLIEHKLITMYLPEKASWFRVATGTIEVSMWIDHRWYIPNCIGEKRQVVPLFAV